MIEVPREDRAETGNGGGSVFSQLKTQEADQCPAGTHVVLQVIVVIE